MSKFVNPRSIDPWQLCRNTRTGEIRAAIDIPRHELRESDLVLNIPTPQADDTDPLLEFSEALAANRAAADMLPLPEPVIANCSLPADPDPDGPLLVPWLNF